MCTKRGTKTNCETVTVSKEKSHRCNSGTSMTKGAPHDAFPFIFKNKQKYKQKRVTKLQAKVHENK